MTGGLVSASTLIQQGRPGEARTVLKELLRHNVRDSQAWLLLSQCVESEDQQRQCLRRVLALEPGHPLAQALLDQLASPTTPILKDHHSLGPESELPAGTVVTPALVEPTPIPLENAPATSDSPAVQTAAENQNLPESDGAAEVPESAPVSRATVRIAQTLPGPSLQNLSETSPDFSPAAIGPALSAAYVATTVEKLPEQPDTGTKPANTAEAQPFQPHSFSLEQPGSSQFEPKSFVLIPEYASLPNNRPILPSWPEWLRPPLDESQTS